MDERQKISSQAIYKRNIKSSHSVRSRKYQPYGSEVANIILSSGSEVADKIPRNKR